MTFLYVFIQKILYQSFKIYEIVYGNFMTLNKEGRLTCTKTNLKKEFGLSKQSRTLVEPLLPTKVRDLSLNSVGVVRNTFS